MQIVIDIPEKRFKDIQRIAKVQIEMDHFRTAEQIIANGKPLPKGHGKIGDLDRLYNVFEKNVVSADAFKELFDHAPTIIEADMEEREE